MDALSDSTEQGGVSPVFAEKHPLKWFGISLVPYREEFRGDLIALYSPHFGANGEPEKLEPIVKKHSAGIFAITRLAAARRFDVIGFTAFLPLSAYGVRLIEFGLFDGADIHRDALADGFRAAGALYWWATVAEGAAFRALPLIELALSQPPYAGKDIFATAGTARGLNAMRRLGFSPLRAGETEQVGSLVARRLASSGRGEARYAL